MCSGTSIAVVLAVTVAWLLAAVAQARVLYDDVVGDWEDERNDEHRRRRGVVLEPWITDDRWPNNCTVPFAMATADTRAVLEAGGYTVSLKDVEVESILFSPEDALVSANFILGLSDVIEPLVGCRFEMVHPSVFAEYYEDPANTLLVVEHYEPKCHVSHVGYRPGRFNRMNLGWCWNETRSILHEMAHVLGLYHEHKSPKALPYLEHCAPGTCEPNDSNCAIVPDVVYEGSTFDLRSIMMYPINYTEACNLQLTDAGHELAAEQNIKAKEVGFVSELSPTDIAVLTARYTQTDFPSHACSYRFRHVPNCPGTHPGCYSIAWIGDDQCDDYLSCYDNDGGTCIPAVTATTATTTTPPPPPTSAVADTPAAPTTTATTTTAATGGKASIVATLVTTVTTQTAANNNSSPVSFAALVVADGKGDGKTNPKLVAILVPSLMGAVVVGLGIYGMAAAASTTAVGAATSADYVLLTNENGATAV